MWNSNLVGINEVRLRRFSMTARVNLLHNSETFFITAVYRPTRHREKDAFLRQIKRLKPADREPWLLFGDFNMIYRACGKNNNNLNLRRMGRFRAALEHCELKEVHLQNRRFTWSNERRKPTLVRLDRFYCNENWDLGFGHHILHALSSGTSDHCPLLLTNPQGPRRPRSFKFENFWTSLPGFKDEVQNLWCQDSTHHEPLHRLADKLSRTAKALKFWARGICSEAKLKYLMALDVIHHLDVAQEHRDLTQAEYRLRLGLKRRLLGFAVIERARKKQASRITNIKEADANTKFFHRKINARRRKNHIHRLKKHNAWAVTHEDKESTIAEHFRHVMWRPEPRSCDLNWPILGYTPIDLSGLDDPFIEVEIHKAIKEMPIDKAPGPDGFTGKFFKSCWDIIKNDVVAAFNALHDSRNTHFNLLNSANVVLIPKKEGAEGIGDYRPISLVHGFGKIFSKVLAIRLWPLMQSLILTNQSAFIRGRSIHDNFMYVRNMVRKYHRTRRPILIFKLDISKAFDSVRWDYLLTLLQNRGFPPKWREWITGLLSASTLTSKIILNRTPGKAIKHGKGLRQGTPYPLSSSS